MRGLKVKCPTLSTKPNLKRAQIRSGRKDGITISKLNNSLLHARLNSPSVFKIRRIILPYFEHCPINNAKYIGTGASADLTVRILCIGN